MAGKSLLIPGLATLTHSELEDGGIIIEKKGGEKGWSCKEKAYLRRLVGRVDSYV